MTPPHHSMWLITGYGDDQAFCDFEDACCHFAEIMAGDEIAVLEAWRVSWEKGEHAAAVDDAVPAILDELHRTWDMEYEIPSWLDDDTGSRDRKRREYIRSTDADIRTEMAMSRVR